MISEQTRPQLSFCENKPKYPGVSEDGLIQYIKEHSSEYDGVKATFRGRNLIHFFYANRDLFPNNWHVLIAQMIQQNSFIDSQALCGFSEEQVLRLQKAKKGPYFHLDLLKKAICATEKPELQKAFFSLLSSYDVAYVSQCAISAQQNQIKQWDTESLLKLPCEEIKNFEKPDFFVDLKIIQEAIRKCQVKEKKNALFHLFIYLKKQEPKKEPQIPPDQDLVQMDDRLADLVSNMIVESSKGYQFQSSSLHWHHLIDLFCPYENHHELVLKAIERDVPVSANDLLQFSDSALDILYREFAVLPVELVQETIFKAETAAQARKFLKFLQKDELRAYLALVKEQSDAPSYEVVCATVARFLQSDLLQRLKSHGIDSKHVFDRKCYSYLTKGEIVALLEASHFVNSFELFMAIKECQDQELSKNLAALWGRIQEMSQTAVGDTINHNQLSTNEFENKLSSIAKDDIFQGALFSIAAPLEKLYPQLQKEAIPRNVERPLEVETPKSLYPIVQVPYQFKEANKTAIVLEPLQLEPDIQEKKGSVDTAQANIAEDIPLSDKLHKAFKIAKNTPYSNNQGFSCLRYVVIPQHTIIRAESSYLDKLQQILAKCFEEKVTTQLLPYFAAKPIACLKGCNALETQVFNLKPIAEFLRQKTHESQMDRVLEFFSLFNLVHELQLLDVLSQDVEYYDLLLPFIKVMVLKMQRELHQENRNGQVYDLIKHLHGFKDKIYFYKYLWRQIVKNC